MSEYVPIALRRFVAARSAGHCEYCRYPQAASFLTFEVKHIIARKHGGQNVEENLALACPFCNQAKGSDIASFDPDTGVLTALFHPRKHVWGDHFALNGVAIEGLTAIGRVTAMLLQFNTPERLVERDLLLASGLDWSDSE
jgi:hypothetical protein